jgi:translation elongation factor EF-G
MDRSGADPEKVCRDMREKLALNVVPLQIHMGEGDTFQGVIDLITMESVTFVAKISSELPYFLIIQRWPPRLVMRCSKH